MSKRLALACDVGNSRVKFGLFERSEPDSVPNGLPICRAAFVFPVDGAVDWDDIRKAVASICRDREEQVPGFLAGSNPGLRDRLQAAWPDQLAGSMPHVVTDPLQSGLRVAVDEPAKVGVDRLLNAVAANAVRTGAGGAIVVDCGTATTIDVVDGEGVFRGGAILPGFELSARSLHHYTALLPLITIEQLAAEPHAPLGKNTRAAMRSGLFWGQLGAVRELISRLSRESAFGHTSPVLLLTGGGAGMLAPHLPEARWEPQLSLQGLVLAGVAAETHGDD